MSKNEQNMEILKFMFLLLFLNSAYSQGWQSPYLNLTKNAQIKGVRFDENSLSLDMPEKAWVPDGFELGNLVYDGGEIVYCIIILENLNFVKYFLHQIL